MTTQYDSANRFLIKFITQLSLFQHLSNMRKPKDMYNLLIKKRKLSDKS